MLKAVILSTGDELTTGRVVDTNSAYIADKLYSLGLEVTAVLKVGDDRERLVWALSRAVECGDILIGTGGLGPTVDDLTNEVVANFLGQNLALHEEVVEALKSRFHSRGIPWTPNNEKQALLPESAALIPNPVGTAPGFRVAVGPGKTLFWLPGVPREMEAMLKESVLPCIERHEPSTMAASSRTFKIHGLTESKLDDLLKDLPLPDGAKLSFRAHYPDLTLRFTFRGRPENQPQSAALEQQIRERLGPYVYGEGDATLEEIVGSLLRKKAWTLALAESCTGGYLSHRITRVPGSSDYFLGGMISYANSAKADWLGVQQAILERHGPVSRETAIAMAEGIKTRTRADVGLSVTGIAGPTGGSAQVPVGTVWIAVAQPGGSEGRQFRFQGDRERVILGASQAALYWLRSLLL
jgi:nicotinamide-nucleotide amidase